ncbi:MAG TPA: hypothetical protein VFN23_05725 [Ktedonobacteraceae bacterium]|nr:hypothetical protein [Ktedonobacteraceae bacterium]
MAAMFHEWNTRKQLSDEKDQKSALHIPMVYEKVQAEPPPWEYHVLSVDLREHEAPDAEALNELGRQGWLLISTIQQPDRGALVHYYFVRQPLG